MRLAQRLSHSGRLGPRLSPYLLVGPGFFSLSHQLFYSFDTSHFLVDSLQHLCPLLQAKENIFLDQGKFHLTRELLQLLQLRICFTQECFLVFLATKSQQGTSAVISRKTFLCDGGLAVCEYGDSFLILTKLIALILQIENGP